MTGYHDPWLGIPNEREVKAMSAAPDLAKIQFLQKLLKKGYDHYFGNGGSPHKTSEGLIEVHILYPNVFQSEYVGSDPEEYCISVYSYVLGPSRMHEFTGSTFDLAYAKAYLAVEQWVTAELEATYDDR